MRTSAPTKPNVQFWVLAVFLTAIFFMGGSSRADVQSLIVLRPLAIFVCGYGILTIKREHFGRYRWVFGLLFGWAVLCIAHLVPLPPGIWQMLPKRNLIVAIDAAVGLNDLWRPLSLAPSDTLNALFSLSIPLAVAFLTAQLGDSDQGHLLKVLLGLGLASGALGFAQAITNGNATLYFYELSNEKTSTGLFSNRNHHALFLALCFPMMAAHVARARARNESSLIYPAAIAVGLMLIPLILLSGSRGGLVFGILAIGLSVSIIGLRTEPRVTADKSTKYGWLMVAGTAVAIAVGAFAFSRAEAIDRLAEFDLSEEIRFPIWQQTLSLARDYLPWGSGIGTFVPVFQINESTKALTLLYINHAHNEFLELLLTGGLPAILLGGLAVGKWGQVLIRMLRAPAKTAVDNAMMQAGLALLLLLFLGSIVDYPARTPALMSVVVIAAIWAQSNRSPPTTRLTRRKKRW